MRRQALEADAVRTCRVCGCTDDDCRVCIERVGGPCWWVKADLCSACVGREVEPVITPGEPMDFTCEHCGAPRDTDCRLELGCLWADDAHALGCPGCDQCTGAGDVG